MQIHLEAKIKQAIPFPEQIIVILDPFADHALYEISNLIGISYSGEELWRAELPSGYGIKANPSTGRYVSITSVYPLKAYSSSGFNCQINPLNGQIIESEFVK